MGYSTSEENYIKSIFHLQADADNVSTNDVAAMLQTRPASVTDMLKKLKAKNCCTMKSTRAFGSAPKAVK